MADEWYADGLAFRCTRCGKCCTGEPGNVYVNDEEVQEIATFRGEPLAQTLKSSTRLVGQQRSLREKPNHDCIFWDRAAGCTIYAVRPRQCRTWPFWESNLKSPEAWEETRAGCPGAGSGQLFSAEEITARMKVVRL